MGKIRNRDPLKPNHKDKRITRSKPNRNYYLTSKAVEITQKKIANKAIRAQKCVESQRKPIVIKRKEDITPTSEDRKDIKFLAHRSHARAYLFIHLYGAPDEVYWTDGDTNIVSEIMKSLAIPHLA